jgi:hypothetical protein
MTGAAKNNETAKAARQDHVRIQDPSMSARSHGGTGD